MDPQTKKRRIMFLRNMPPMFSLMVVVAFGIIFYKLVQGFNFSTFHFSQLTSILSPFIIGLVFTFFLVPPVKAFEKLLLRSRWMQAHQKGAGALAVLISYVLILGLLILVLIYVMPQVFSGLSTLITLLIDSLQYLYNHLGLFIEYWDASSWSTFISGQQLSKFLGDQLSSLTLNLQNIASAVLPMIYQTVVDMVSGSLNTLVGIIVSIYIVADRDHIAYGGKRVLYAIFKKEHANHILSLAQETLSIFRRFFVGKLLDSLIIGILCYILMKIFRLPYAELISVIVGVTNVIPYFGPFIGAIPSILITLMVSPMDALIFAVMILALQQLDGNVIGPAILGSSLGLKPIWIIFSVTVGGGLFGIVGMLIGVPAFTVIYTWINRFIEKRLKKKELNDPDQIRQAEAPEPAAAESSADPQDP